MPPLNQEFYDIGKSDEIYEVKVSERNRGPDNDSSHTRDTYYLESLEAALYVAAEQFDDRPRMWHSNLSLVILSEEHDDDEVYLRVAITNRRVFAKKM
jgi:hypothetical protein